MPWPFQGMIQQNQMQWNAHVEHGIGAKMNQQPLAHQYRWMVDGWETFFLLDSSSLAKHGG